MALSVALTLVGSETGTTYPPFSKNPNLGDFDLRALARIQTPPMGLPPPLLPRDNPPTAEKIALGRKLFFDRRLSVNATMSCAMCHIPEQGFTNNELARPIGVAGRSLRRNAPSLLNTAYLTRIFHDGRVPTLEKQVESPLFAGNEMANPSVDDLISRICAMADYDGLFERVFEGKPTLELIGQAIATWERTLLAGNSPFDHWRYGGRTDALSVKEQTGFELFSGKGRCATCHTVGQHNALFTDGAFHDTGIGYMRPEVREVNIAAVRVELAPGVHTFLNREAIVSVSNPPLSPDLGRFEATEIAVDRGRFRTPSLRNVDLTAPYMHNGSLPTLEVVIEFYNLGGVPHSGLDPLIGPLHLDAGEVSNLVAFLKSLTSEDLSELITDARSVPVGN